ncbi:MAG: glutamate--tRNA ligase [Hyphomicrobiales bacterium]|nr:glutamate--tRNA ligase [Hyphomicrobiales bacterium]
MTVKVRFAPSPTGHLHIGNIRPALLNWLFARREGGHYLLRFDDTDLERSKEEYVEGIREDLTWLGLNWDAEERQSRRGDRYAEVAAQLKAAGRLYACYETPEELERRRKRQVALKQPPVYDRASLKLTDADRAKLEAEGRKPYWRFLLEGGAEWDDQIRGPQRIEASAVSDPVLVREDGTALYTFTSVVDDVDFAITHVIRGEDHVTNTAVQIQIFQAMGAAPPVFAHHNLLIGADGGALSKRLGSLSVRSFREEGLEPLAVVSHSALIGTSDPVQPHHSLESLSSLFDLKKISRGPARFDMEELRGLNAKLLHDTPFAAVKKRLAALKIKSAETFWNAVRPNLIKFDDVKIWWAIVKGPIQPAIENADFIAAARELLPPEPWSEETWGQWTGAVKAATGAKGRDLFHPLRLALTAQGSGPDMKHLLPLIGREKTLARLAGRAV